MDRHGHADSGHWHYCLQLNIYKAILESKYGIKVSEMQLVCLHPDNKNRNYMCIEMVDLSDEVASLLQMRSLEVSANVAVTLAVTVEKMNVPFHVPSTEVDGPKRPLPSHAITRQVRTRRNILDLEPSGLCR